MIDAVRYTKPLYERCEPDAAGYDEDWGVVSKSLKHAAQPTQKLVGPLDAIFPAKYTLEEYRQFVDDEEHRLVLLGACTEQLLPLVSPVSGIQIGTELRTKFVRTDFFNINIVAYPAFYRGCKTKRDVANRMHGPCDICDCVFRAGRSLDVGEEEDPTFSLKPLPELSGNTSLPHAPLSGQQHVVAVADPRLQYPQLALAIEKVVAAYPAAGR